MTIQGIDWRARYGELEAQLEAMVRRVAVVYSAGPAPSSKARREYRAKEVSSELGERMVVALPSGPGEEYAFYLLGVDGIRLATQWYSAINSVRVDRDDVVSVVAYWRTEMTSGAAAEPTFRVVKLKASSIDVG